ncbi:glucoamylase family protein [Dysgonomonas sp. ZJ709]|uniref:glucoamylase family protein n=1 Tax=Dysgonomonas sp. ZJ709 TaxID=2709797 RepID=UPI0013EB6EE5|nr:glucoamylase family protein [Dysgonomonas sp. ZJ709]
MKKIFILTLLSFGCISLMAQEPEYDHVFFDNSLMSGSYYNSKADYASPSYIENIQKKLPVSEQEFFTAKNSLLLKYVSAPNGNWSAAVLYTDWRGKDFVKESTSLDFRMKITSKTNKEELPSIAIATEDEKQISSYLNLGKYITNISNNWCHVRIPLSDFQNIKYTHSKEIKNVLFKQSSQDGKEHTIYIDQIELSPAKIEKPNIAKAPSITANGYERHVDIAWNKVGLENIKYIKIYRASENGSYQPVGIQDPSRGRFADFTGDTDKIYNYKITCLDYDYNETPASNEVVAKTYTMTDEQLLTMLQEASFRYYWDGAEEHSGLALENIPGRKNMIASGASGFGILAIITAVERGFITREEAVERFKKIVAFLDKTETFHGGYSHFINGEDGKVIPFFGNKDNGADMVETSFLFQGLLTARQYFDKDSEDETHIRKMITKLWENIEWDWYKQTKDSKYLYWHWSPDQAWVINHRLIGWNETMITYLLAIASPTHGVSKDIYYTGWASQDQYAQDYRANWGQTRDGSMYSNGNTYQGVKLDVGVSTGGPLFFLHYSYLGFDPRGIKDKYVSKDYFDNFRNIALINHRYCIENPKGQQGYGADNWGLTASDGPWGYHAAEAALHQDDGTMAPTGALASFPYLPEESMAAFKNYYRNYGSFLWGEYGFRDAFNLNENWCASIYMGLNQAPVTVMIENYRTGLLWNLFMKDPDVKKMTDKVFIK